ncbi:hypothetical protein ACOME3_004027 [Neoechinorhynchus agilis]
MGRKCYRYLNGKYVYVCSKCQVHLAKKRDIVSRRFNGSTGPAILFKRAYNVLRGPVQEKALMTGRHLVRDIFCAGCEEKIGWEYEYSVNSDQKYKEAKTVIENAFIREETQPKLLYKPDSDSDSNTDEEIPIQ